LNIWDLNVIRVELTSTGADPCTAANITARSHTRCSHSAGRWSRPASIRQPSCKFFLVTLSR
jgi:hypothetical protein